jgi:hypothetical protein
MSDVIIKITFNDTFTKQEIVKDVQQKLKDISASSFSFSSEKPAREVPTVEEIDA